jgi:fluoride ion exporter CrcB/FEX
MIKRLSIRLLALLTGIICSLTAVAQDKPEMADLMRSNGKIYIVVAVCLTILIGLFLYAWSIDRKISRLEKEK